MTWSQEGNEVDHSTSAAELVNMVDKTLDREMRENERERQVGAQDGSSRAGERVMTQSEINQEKRENFNELMYSFNSFSAVFWPVSCTVILAGLAIVYINDGTNGDGSGLSTLPTVVNEDTTNTNLEKAGAAVLNALVYVGIITGVTFFMVALFYFNMIKTLIAFLLTSTALLLFFTTSYMVFTAFQVFQVPFDVITFYFFFWNYAICGLIAIFYQKGIPVIVNQGYLVCVSVVMAWLLVQRLPEWTAWAFLILLAMYDLCAVLTPVGPLKCLIEISQDRDVGMPGLLYEATITNNHQAPINDASSVEASSQSSGRRSNGHGAGVVGPLGTFVFMAQPDQPNRGESSDRNGRVVDMEAPRSAGPPPPSDNMESYAERDSIKLGLGDFVFYSVLVGKAALNGFSTFVAVYFVVVSGLAGTLFLLAVYHKALPALPISIFFGVFFYFVADSLVTPMVNSLTLNFASL